jgi:ABC-type Mn2+/Zn2+ transport system ATPase subunit
MSLNLSLKDNFFLPHLACDIELSVTKGKIHVISGENGIGKTTFLKRVADQIHSLKVVHAEQSPPDFFFDRRLQKYKEIVVSSGEIDHSLFQHFWTASGLSSKEDRALSRLSGGEGQLLKLISACSAHGELFFLDEPGQYLDPEKRKLADELFQRLISLGKTLVIVEHDPKWISSIGSSSELYVKDDILKARMK